MCPRNPDRCKAVAIDGYRLTQEIEINIVPRPEITISTCGKQVSVSDIRKDTTSLPAIDPVICLLDYTMPCTRKTIKDEDQFLKLGWQTQKLLPLRLTVKNSII